MTLRRGLIATLLSTLLVAGIAPVFTSASQAASSCWTYTTAEKRFAHKINDVRAAKGLPHLKLDPELSKTSRHHTYEMIKADRGLFHTTEQQFLKRVTKWVYIGENVGYGATVDQLHSAFMHSPEHYANIVGPHYRYIGVGVMHKNDTMWVTIQFEGFTDPGTTMPMPSGC